MLWGWPCATSQCLSRHRFLNLDITDQYAKGLTSIDAADMSLLIAGGGDLEIPEAFAGISRLAWLMVDPDIERLAAAAPPTRFRAAGDVLREQVARLRPFTANTSDNS